MATATSRDPSRVEPFTLSFPVPVLTADTIDAFISQPRRVAVWFFAAWGATDRMTKHLLAALPEEQRSVAALAAFDLDTAFGPDSIVHRFGILSVTTFVFFEHGAELRRHSGMQSARQLADWLAELSIPNDRSA